MPGPPPKSKDQRRRRNIPAGGEWVVLPKARRGRAPALPGDDWTTATKKWWAEIWRSPMATQWQAADVPALRDLARLKQSFWAGDYTVASEIARREDRFGLTPKGRKDLRWIITDEDAERAGTPAKGKGGRRHLQVVDG